MGNGDYDSYAVVRRKWAAPRERLGQRQAILGSLRHYTIIGQRVAQCSPDYTDELSADGFESARPRPGHSARDCWTHGAAQIFGRVQRSG